MNGRVQCIYSILCKSNGRKYIGSTVNFENRKKTHLYSLRKKKANKPMQNSFNKYGEDDFVFEIIEIIKFKKHLVVREQFWIDRFEAANCRKGFNVRKIADSNRGIVPTKGYKWKVDHPKKITLNLKKLKKYWNDGLTILAISKKFGVSKTVIVRELIENKIHKRGEGVSRNMCKISNNHIENMHKKGMTQNEIAKYLGVSMQVIHYRMKASGVENKYTTHRPDVCDGKIFYLREVKGLMFTEISKEFDCTAATIRQRMLKLNKAA